MHFRLTLLLMYVNYYGNKYALYVILHVYLGVTLTAQTAKNRGLFFTVLGSEGRALRGSAFASVLRSTAHSSYRRSPPIPNAVVHSL